MSEIRPYRIDVPAAVLDDLQERLTRTRWPESETVDDWTQGIPLAYTKELAAYWADGYDWRSREAALNDIRSVPDRNRRAGPPFHPSAVAARRRTAVGVDARLAGLGGGISQGDRAAGQPAFGPGRRRLPRDLPVAARLRFLRQADRDRLGRGEDRRGMGDAGRPARLRPLRRPGRRLGCGGDDPDRPQRRTLRGHPPEHADGEARSRLRRNHRGRPTGVGRVRRTPEVGYRLLQATIHPAADAGLRAGRLPGGSAGMGRRKVLGMGRLRRTSRKDLQPRRIARQRDDVLGHWKRRLVSAKLYWESFNKFVGNGRVELPTGVASFPKEILRTPRSWCEAAYNITHWTTMPRGGHFAAFEQPELLVDDIRTFFATVR